VGDGPLKDEYVQFVENNNLNDCVFITGKKTYNELQELYRKANFLVQPGLIEGFGKAPVEAMLHGVIPLLSEVPMAKEMTGEGKRGYIFSVNDSRNLEHLIYKIMNEQKSFGEMIKNGREYVKEQTLEKWADNYVQTVNYFFEN
jgi:glycosyltransferase involved in cell wall biosynthesis